MKIEHLIADNTVFHCDTPEKAMEFIKKAHELGYHWLGSCDNETNFDLNGNESCYKLCNNCGKSTIFVDCKEYFDACEKEIIEYKFDREEKKDKLTPLEYLMQYWGIEEGEKFNIINEGSKLPDSPYYFKNGCLYDKLDKLHRSIYYGFLNGSYKVQKTPWKPKDRELVWSIDCHGDTYSTNFFETYKNDLAMLKCGWYFKTKAEAEANRERVLKEYSEVLGDE